MRLQRLRIALGLAVLGLNAGCGNSGVPIEGVQEDKEFANPDSGAVPASLPVIGALEVTKLMIYNADTNLPVRELADGDTIRLSDYDHAIALVAETNPTLVGSVGFYFNTALKRIENEAPYSLTGDVAGDFNAWTPRTGTRVVKVVPYADVNLSGTVGTAIEYSLTFED